MKYYCLLLAQILNINNSVEKFQTKMFAVKCFSLVEKKQ